MVYEKCRLKDLKNELTHKLHGILGDEVRPSNEGLTTSDKPKRGNVRQVNESWTRIACQTVMSDGCIDFKGAYPSCCQLSALSLGASLTSRQASTRFLKQGGPCTCRDSRTMRRAHLYVICEGSERADNRWV